MPHRPKWFKDNYIIMSNAPTCGINKDGLEQLEVDKVTGKRKETIDDKLLIDATKLSRGKLSGGYLIQKKVTDVIKSQVFVPQYHDYSTLTKFRKTLTALKGFTYASLGELQEKEALIISGGHGSPSSDQRLGDIPYIKVSDIRAGHININPTNLIPLDLAKVYWNGDDSGLKPYDLISPERASKNIGEFAVLMPGQEQIVLTKEVIIIRSLTPNLIDQFYLMWALSLYKVRRQWDRIILMQTNREDVGKRMLEIEIPVPPSKKEADKLSKPFKDYFEGISSARNNLLKGLDNSGFHHALHLE